MAPMRPDIQLVRVWALLSAFGAILLILGWYRFIR